MKKKDKELQGTLFEEDYLIRTLGPIANTPDIALTELVANAWDAGASKVQITIPEEKGENLIIEDDGSGMTAAQFRERWMTLGYNRVKHQGVNAEFPPERASLKRPAYGRNGVGRHGLLCFADRYDVETQREGKFSIFSIATTSGKDPFVIVSENTIKTVGQGTKLSTAVSRHLPDPGKILDVLAARFLHDPEFTVYVNGHTVPLEDHTGLIDKTVLQIARGVRAEAFFVDSTKSARNTRQQGIAFWIDTRLVGTPSWTLGIKPVIDGRTSIAKRYTAVIKIIGMIDHVLPDWTGFKSTTLVEELYNKVEEYILMMFKKLSTERVQDTKESVFREYRDDIEKLQPLARLDVSEFVAEIAEKSYVMPQESLSLAVETIIKLEKSKSGVALLEKLSKLAEEDVEGLDRLLSDWSVRDALTVLDEIDKRIAVVEALGKLSSDQKVDELRTLHPLVTQARWLFGPEFESAEYASNLSLRNAVAKVFDKKVDKAVFENYRKRPDLLLLGDATLSAVAIDEYDETSGLTKMRDILLIELKRGGFEIDRKEMNQAQEYVEELLTSGAIEGRPYIRAFVVGHACKQGLQPVRKVGENPETARIQACNYGQLVRTAEQRLFKLKERLQDRYEQLSGNDILAKVMLEPKQMPMHGLSEIK
jgi:hypothetical protein